MSWNSNLRFFFCEFIIQTDNITMLCFKRYETAFSQKFNFTLWKNKKRLDHTPFRRASHIEFWVSLAYANQWLSSQWLLSRFGTASVCTFLTDYYYRINKPPSAHQISKVKFDDFFFVFVIPPNDDFGCYEVWQNRTKVEECVRGHQKVFAI